jgi:uncharacterized protein (DUF1697 family)
MPRYVAFLRAINVGGHTVKMDRLRGLFETLGFANVETFIASGNVIFESTEEDTRALEKRIEGHLQETLGYPVAAFLRTLEELDRVVEYMPFEDVQAGSESPSLYVALVAAVPNGELKARLEALQTAADKFHVNECEIYWMCRTKISESVYFGAKFEKILGIPATLRNITTLRKLVKKYPV